MTDSSYSPNHWQRPKPSRKAFAVWRRNTRVWLKLIKASLVFNFGEPLIYLLGFGVGFGQFIDSMDGLSYMSFLASGLIVSSIMNSTSFEAMYSVYTRMDPQQTYAAMMASPLTVDDIVAGELLWCAHKGLMNGIAIMAVGFGLGALSGWTALLALPVMVLAGLSFAGLAIIITPFAKSYDFFTYFYTLVIMPMFLCSGVFFPLENLPQWAQAAAQILPLSHAVELVRPLVTGQIPTNVVLHLSVLAIHAALGYYIALVFFRRRLIV